jgi:Cu/Ag efflux protein CusF
MENNKIRLLEIFDKVNGTNIILENKAQAEKLMREKGANLKDPDYIRLKTELLKRNAMGYLGFFVNLWLTDIFSAKFYIKMYDDFISNKEIVKALPKPILTYTDTPELQSTLNTIKTKFKVKRYIDAKVHNLTLKRDIIENLSGDTIHVYNNAIIDLIKHGEKVEATFFRKSSRFEKSVDFLEGLKKFILDYDPNFNYETIKGKIQQLGSYNAEIVYDDPENQKILVLIKTYEASNKVGSRKWCIQYSETHWEDYSGGPNKKQFFLYDFNRDDNFTLVGFTMEGGEAHEVFDIDDTSLDSLDKIPTLKGIEGKVMEPTPTDIKAKEAIKTLPNFAKSIKDKISPVPEPLRQFLDHPQFMYEYLKLGGNTSSVYRTHDIPVVIHERIESRWDMLKEWIPKDDLTDYFSFSTGYEPYSQPYGSPLFDWIMLSPEKPTQEDVLEDYENAMERKKQLNESTHMNKFYDLFKRVNKL